MPIAGSLSGPPHMGSAEPQTTDHFGSIWCHGAARAPLDLPPDLAAETPSSGPRIRSDLAAVLAGETPSAGLRPEIVDSWRQSAAFGLMPDRFDLPLDVSDEKNTRLSGAATPAIDRLGSDLASTQVSVVLAGQGCRVAARRAPGPLEEARLDELRLTPGYLWDIAHAGTNGLGAAFGGGVPFLVHGDEHFADALATLTTAGAPIHDPHTGHVLGVLAFICSAEAVNELLVPMVSRAVREIEQRLVNSSRFLDRLVQTTFLDARRRTRGPLAAVSPTTLLTNAAASRLLPAVDHAGLWDFVSRNLGVPGPMAPRFRLADGSALDVSLESIPDGNEVAGALVRLAVPTNEVSKPLRPTFGWDSLTAAENSVSELVAEGLTNRQLAARLFLSPHTVDSHLRHIFRKLDINSRVDLVRMVVARSIAEQPLAGAAVA
jgi:DNA-binding CsgD family transcriptional regulator